MSPSAINRPRHPVAWSDGVIGSRFDVQHLPMQQRLLAWRDAVGHVIDVQPSREALQAPFGASISRYRFGERLFTDCSSDALLLERSVARISTDNQRDYALHVFTEGSLEVVQGVGASNDARRKVASIVLLDLNQPVRMRRSKCRMLTLFVPRSIVEAALPNAEALHGRVFDTTTALSGLLIEQVAALSRELPGMDVTQAINAFDVCVQLLVAAFGRQAGLTGDGRAAVRSAMFDRARRYVRSHLHRSSLTPESVFTTLQVPRPSLYRLFEHEGGIGTYIRNCRLREACQELVVHPHRSVAEIAYGMGFGSASDFARAFRRAFDMTPQEMRTQALARLHDNTNS